MMVQGIHQAARMHAHCNRQTCHDHIAPCAVYCLQYYLRSKLKGNTAPIKV
jgi:hypothetical protein